MKKYSLYYKFKLSIIIFLSAQLLFSLNASGNDLQLNDSEYFEKQGLNVLVFNNWYNENFDDSKISGIEIIHHGVRTATNGDVRLEPTPGQWDPFPNLVERKINKKENSIEILLRYPGYNFEFKIRAAAADNGILLSVHLEKYLPKELEGKAGFNLEFLPSAYFEKSFIIDGKTGTFPLYPTGPIRKTKSGETEPEPIARGNRLTLAPEDPERRITIMSKDNELLLYDGRNSAQNGWYVLRSLIPADKNGKVIEWFLKANTIPNWIRTPIIGHSQLGYHPEQKKVAVIELDKNDTPLKKVRLFNITKDGKFIEKHSGEIKKWGKYFRYNYFTFDFTKVKDPGLYLIEYGQVRTKPFRIAEDIYENAWHPTLDIFFPVQMDHMFVNEAYRVWHGTAHLDDALQAPVNHEHFDMYAQGPTTDTPYKPGEHIPGLNIGGWFDAGDYDIRTQTHYSVITNLVLTWENFHPTRDETTIDQAKRYVDIHHPDGIPDILQQIEHGTLALIAQYRAVGHAIPGIISSDLSKYTHLGDAITMTDNLIYNSKLDSLESNGYQSGTPDDRWAFTSKSSALNYGSAAALSAASRALRGYNDKLAEECLSTAQKVWKEEHSHEPDTFKSGNTTGGPLPSEELKCAVELLITTKEDKYRKRIKQLIKGIEEEMLIFSAIPLTRAIPYMDQIYEEEIKDLAESNIKFIEEIEKQNPYGVPISTRGWGGSGLAMFFSIYNYFLYKAFPDLIDREYVFKGLNYIYGCHPGSDISFVSGVGTDSKMVAYGNNRADFSFIAGGVVPGVIILKPDFPENKEDWPFLWGENEYVISGGASYIFLVNATNDLLNQSED
jgi:endoglucanase